jgi:hypothetical protein
MQQVVKPLETLGREATGVVWRRGMRFSHPLLSFETRNVSASLWSASLVEG